MYVSLLRRLLHIRIATTLRCAIMLPKGAFTSLGGLAKLFKIGAIRAAPRRIGNLGLFAGKLWKVFSLNAPNGFR